MPSAWQVVMESYKEITFRIFLSASKARSWDDFRLRMIPLRTRGAPADGVDVSPRMGLGGSA